VKGKQMPSTLVKTGDEASSWIAAVLQEKVGGTRNTSKLHKQVE
jgi:hypothetical protein